MTDTPMMRAARALVLQESGTDSFDGLEPELQAQVIESVKAVLMAVREPSEAMIKAASDAYGHVGDEGGYVDLWTSEYQRIHQAMIDAAIAEG